MNRIHRIALALAIGPVTALGCATRTSVPEPTPVVELYAAALERGDAEAIYALMSEESRRAMSLDDLRRVLSEQKAELRQHAAALESDERVVDARAEVRYDDGEIVTLDLEEGHFRITAADALPAAPAGIPVVAFLPTQEDAANRYIGDVLVGGGLAPLASRRSEVAVSVGGPDGDTVAMPLRLVVGDRVRAAGAAPAGATAVLPFGPFPAGWVEGYVETDPDALRGDDRRWFATRVRLPPRARIPGAAAPPPFLSEALDVLEASGRLRRAGPGEAADVVLSLPGARATTLGGVTVFVPPADAALLPALNRQLAGEGIPWRYEAEAAEGETRVATDRTGAGMEGLRVRRAYRLAAPGPDDALRGQVVARLESGAPWLVEGRAGRGAHYRLMASPLVPEATELPVSASMVPLVEWLLTPAGSGGGEGGLLAGEPLSLPPAATSVEAPSGTRAPVDGTRVFRVTREPGIHVVLAGDSVLERVAVNPPSRESLLEPLAAAELEARLGGDLRTASDAGSWSETVFTSRQGPELWRPLLLAALVLLLLEGWVAASGRAAAASPAGSRATPREDRAPAA
ncbi:MAG: hypothetical protein KY453_10860 [Gemmatimonadetes bacterium]|nr:hypothetical protein [Gemmatimonadota bacterium]